MDELRIGSAERDEASEVVRAAYADGRLDEGELEERLGTILMAKTRRDLLPVYEGLPVSAPPVATSAPAYVAPAAAPPDLRTALTPILFVCAIVTIIWALTSRGYFWPQWVYLGMTLPAFMIVMSHLRNR